MIAAFSQPNLLIDTAAGFAFQHASAHRTPATAAAALTPPPPYPLPPPPCLTLARTTTVTDRDDRLRHELREKLGRGRRTCPLFDTRRWVRDAEDALRWAWERHEAGLPPAHRPAGEMTDAAGRAL